MNPHPHLLANLLIALTASMAYGILFNVPRSALLASGITGLLGWLGFTGVPLVIGMSPAAGALSGSILVSIASEVFARRTNHPVTVFIVPGIIPLVPGYSAYSTMLLFLEGHIAEGLDMAVETSFLAGGVACGLLVVGSVFRAAKLARRHELKRNKLGRQARAD